ncbi:hypothetical protein SKAU_G00022450 [Synaphobranchus kaupii]|uniref:Uncharacterized protein n=1 Tax=Synaphobranchus kaupii TaxID=118154 RepID=A0A9Q1GDY4_SYNKA|nr:hypothetical protein SKAU_G00022450 [Synaphobranchus kaupii]
MGLQVPNITVVDRCSQKQEERATLMVPAPPDTRENPPLRIPFQQRTAAVTSVKSIVPVRLPEQSSLLDSVSHATVRVSLKSLLSLRRPLSLSPAAEHNGSLNFWTGTRKSTVREL